MKNLAIFIIIFFIFFILFFIPKTLINIQLVQNHEYYELFFGAILIVFLFGYFQYLITNDETYLDNSFLIGIFFMLWYYSWRLITNYSNLDKNNIVRFN